MYARATITFECVEDIKLNDDCAENIGPNNESIRKLKVDEILQ